MHASLAIRNFRCFDDLSIEPLTRVNLIAGRNNVGKSALLEALWILSYPTAPRVALQNTQRDLMDYGLGGFFAELFPKYRTDLTIRLQSENVPAPGIRTLNIQRKYRAQETLFDWSAVVSETELDDDAIAGFDFSNEMAFEYVDETGSGFLNSAWLDADSVSGRLRPVLRDNRTSRAMSAYPCVFSHPMRRVNARTLASRFGRADLEGYLPDIEEIIRLLEPGLKRMTTITDNRGVPSIHGDIGAGRLFPMAIMGEGTKRLLALSLAFLGARDGLILIDEVETGLHHNVLVDVWKSLDWLSREFNVQVFATTHSYECIRAARSVFKLSESGDELAYIRLQRNYQTQRIECVPYDDIAAFDYAMEYGREVR